MKNLKQTLVPSLVLLIAVSFGNGTDAQAQQGDLVPVSEDMMRCLKADPGRSPTDMKACGVVLIKEASGDLSYIGSLKGIAERNKDIIRVNCLNDKLVQARALVNLTDAAKKDLDAAPDNLVADLFNTVSFSTEKMRELRTQADACVGEELSYVGGTQVEVDSPLGEEEGGGSGGGETTPVAPVDDPLPSMSPMS